MQDVVSQTESLKEEQNEENISRVSFNEMINTSINGIIFALLVTPFIPFNPDVDFVKTLIIYLSIASGFFTVKMFLNTHKGQLARRFSLVFTESLIAIFFWNTMYLAIYIINMIKMHFISISTSPFPMMLLITIFIPIWKIIEHLSSKSVILKKR